MPDNEHTLASLGESEILSVKDAVGPPIPEFCQPPDKGTKVPSVRRRQDTGDVLPKNPAGAQSFSQAKKLEGQVAAGIGQASPQPGDAEGLARGAAGKNVNWTGRCGNFGEVAIEPQTGEMVGEYSARKLLDLGGERVVRDAVECQFGATDAGTDAVSYTH